jgi:hypothetical protein
MTDTRKTSKSEKSLDPDKKDQENYVDKDKGYVKLGKEEWALDI